MIIPPIPFEYLAKVRHSCHFAFADNVFESLERPARTERRFNEAGRFLPSIVARDLEREAWRRRLLRKSLSIEPQSTRRRDLHSDPGRLAGRL